jgi:putative ABC transport system permease protein
LLAAAIGSALGELAVRLTRARRVAPWVVAAVAAVVIGAAMSWSLVRSTPRDRAADRHLLAVTASTLTWDDFRALKATLPPDDLVVPYLHQSELVASDEQNWKTFVVGTSPDYFGAMGLQLAAGERFEASTNKVVVLGDTIVKQLFGAGKNPVGEEIRIKQLPFTIVGVLAHRGIASTGQDLDDVALVPVETYMTRLTGGMKSRLEGSILISPAPHEDFERVEADVRSLLRDRHRLVPGEADDFTIHAR